MSVVLGRKILVPYVATHWAIKVGETWYEVEGASKEDTNSPNKIARRCGGASQLGAVPLGGGLVGTTRKCQAEIDGFVASWLAQHPTYNIMTCNCQMFCKDFADFLCDGCADLVKMESGVRGHGQGPSAWNAAGDGTAAARASVGHAEAQHGIAKVRAEGPHAGARAIAGAEGFGAFAEASYGRADANLGPIGVHANLNANTGAGMRNGNLEASVVGFGFQVGQDGVGLRTPIGGADCVLQ